ncbi:hypothetical protein FKR81_13730 [Lentzea tibetensis]|uniref:Uncharacterized protein n=1 Tax=Lentzea tibetensis TaxID=2591470 RepID=A0A563EW49_9PSEU|nr:hypothetical protein [Lentzea tibetensis]TWP51899.1 hypothetical protein FKR81_13730 [Lentzea tibetensis]
MDDDQLKQQLAELRRTANEAAKQGSAAASQLPSITSRITAVERKVRAVAERQDRVDLDDWPELTPEVIALCRDHFSISLPRAADTKLKLVKAEEASANYLRQFKQAVHAARAFTRPGARNLKEHKRKWDSFVVTAQQRPHEQLALAQQAHAEYLHERGELEQRKQAAEDAVKTVRKVVRERLEPALDRDEVVPLWFENALGPYAPSTDTGWLKTAVDLVVYRIAFGVTARPYTFNVQISSAPQQKEHDRLKKECEKHKTA